MQAKTIVITTHYIEEARQAQTVRKHKYYKHENKLMEVSLFKHDENNILCISSLSILDCSAYVKVRCNDIKS